MVEPAEAPEMEQVEETQGTAKAAADADTEKRRIIIDTDTGADDASAIIFAALAPDVVIEGVTVVTGNVDLDQGARNALMALEVAGSDAKVTRARPCPTAAARWCLTACTVRTAWVTRVS